LILSILVQQGARGESVDRALVNSAQLLHFDLVEILHHSVDNDNFQCFSDAFDSVVANDQWLSCPDALDILQIMIQKGATPNSASDALVRSAQEGNFDAVHLLTYVVEDPSVFSEAFDALIQSGPMWLQDGSYALLENLLARGLLGDNLNGALIEATQSVILGNSSLDLLALLLNHGAYNNYNYGEAFQLATEAGSFDVLEILLRYPADSITLYTAFQTALLVGHEKEVVLELFQTFSRSYEQVRPDVNTESELGSPLIFY
jgi:hypothetical protein